MYSFISYYFTLSYHFRFPLLWSSIRRPCKTETNHLQFVYLPGVPLVLYGRHCLQYVLCQTHYLEQHHFTLVDDDQCPSPRVTIHRSPLFAFPHHQRYLSMTLSFLQRRMLLLHLGHDISLYDSSHCWRNFTPFSYFDRQTIKLTLHCARRILPGRWVFLISSR
jgi:hypothetical protein